MNTLDLSADIIDVRDIIARVQELETEMIGEIPDGTTWKGSDADIEHRSLIAILSDLEGLGGDEKWRGHWYPLTLIRDSYFRTYAEELADDIGAIPKDAGWPLTCIDWEQAARELRYDYTGIDIDGTTYWTR
jgi:hypothetical protein